VGGLDCGRAWGCGVDCEISKIARIASGGLSLLDEEPRLPEMSHNWLDQPRMWTNFNDDGRIPSRFLILR
jgi:hypothetical protein